MGSEFAPPKEWNHDDGLPFDLAQTSERKSLQLLVGELNRLHREDPSLYELDCEPAGFSWIDVSDADHSVISFERRARDLTDRMVVVLNFTPEPRHNYRVGVPFHGHWDELLNTDAVEFGGSGQGNLGGVEASPIRFQGRPFSLNLVLPPLGAVFMKPQKKPITVPTRG
jgi:1,4-alpha-glucan branching enzyme